MGVAMPKMKTHKSMRKRFRVTANGKLKRRQAGKKHLLSHKSGPTLVANPGALQRARPKTFLILNLASRKLATMEVPDP